MSRRATIALALIVLAFCIAAISGCAHCTPPIERAAQHGVPLECRVDKSDPRRDICRVSTESGDRDFHYVRCQ